MIGNKEVMNISVEDIIPNRFQPRLAFGEKELNELADSIKQHGIIQPLLLRKIGDKYEIIAGERRYKASTIAGLNNVPAIIVETDDNTSAEIAITENIQRKDLTAIEEAQSYKKLLDRGQTQDGIAKKLGIGQSTVANKIRLLSLTDEAQEALLNGKISERHARSLLRLVDPSTQVTLLNRIINERLTVKQTDEEINRVLNVEVLDEGPGQDEKIEIPTFDTIETFDIPKEEKFETEPEKEEISIIEDDVEELTPFSGWIESEPVLENSIKPLEEKEKTNSPLIEEFKTERDIMEIKEEPTKFLEVINKTRGFTNDLETSGFNVTTEEFDFEDMYQIVIKIKKD